MTSKIINIVKNTRNSKNMSNFLDKQVERRLIEAKLQKSNDPSSTSSIFARMDHNIADWKSNTPDNYAREAYVKNVVAYRCIKEIADNIGGLYWEVYNKRTGRVIEKHPLLDLLDRPNPMQSGNSFFSQFESFKQISGDSYMQAIGPDSGAPRELYVLPASRMKIEPGDTGIIPKYYEYTPKKEVSGNNAKPPIKFPVDSITGSSEVLHIKTFNPLSDWYGQSPIEAAAFSIDLHNEASEWNMRLLENGARPSGALVVEDELSADQMEITREAFDNTYGGPGNAGKPMFLSGRIKWHDMMLSPRDMDYLESKNVAARDIATAFRVPPILLNIGSDTTFANMKEARLSMVENTIMPEADLICAELNNWLVPMFGDTIGLRYNKDMIPAIMAKRSEIYALLKDVNFLTINEKREMAGFEEVIDGDLLPHQMVAPQSDQAEEDEDDDESKMEKKAELIQTQPSNGHYHKYDDEQSGQTTESDDHVHSYIVGDTKTSVVDGHSHKLQE